MVDALEGWWPIAPAISNLCWLKDGQKMRRQVFGEVTYYILELKNEEGRDTAMRRRRRPQIKQGRASRLGIYTS